MPTIVKPLVHSDSDAAKKSEEELDKSRTEEAHKYLAANPALRFVSDLITALRKNPNDETPEKQYPFAWWTAEMLHERFSPQTRMAELEQRPDLRQGITTVLTGCLREPTRIMPADLQAQIIGFSLQSRKFSKKVFDLEFDPDVTVTYGDPGAYVLLFLEKLPWNDSDPKHQVLVQRIIESLLAHGILTHWDVLNAIDRKVWQKYVPIEIRMAVDAAHLAQEKEKPGRAFAAKDIVAIATPQVMSENIQLKDLRGVVETAVKKMGFEKKEEPKPEPVADDKVPTVAPAAPAAPVVVAIPPTDRSPAIVAESPKADPDPAKPSKKDDEAEVTINVEDDDRPTSTELPKAKLASFDLPKVTAHLSNSAFEKAGGASTMEKGADDSHKSDAISFSVFEVENALGIEIEELPSEEVREDLKTLVVDRKMIDDEKRLRAALTVLLPKLDPSGHPAKGDWAAKPIDALRSDLKKLLEKSEKGKPVADALFPRKSPPFKSR